MGESRPIQDNWWPDPLEILIDPNRKPPDSTPVTGQRWFLRYPTRFQRVGWWVFASKLDFNRPDRFYHQKGRRSPSYIQFLSQISPDPARSRWYSAWSCQDPTWSLQDSVTSLQDPLDLVRSCIQGQFSARFVEFRPDLPNFWPDLTSFG